MRCAVPAFMRVEPAIGSGPVSRKTGESASSRIGVPRLLAMPMVERAARAWPRAGRPRVNGVVPLAATAISTRPADASVARSSSLRMLALVLGAFDRLHHALRGRRRSAAAAVRAASRRSASVRRRPAPPGARRCRRRHRPAARARAAAPPSPARPFRAAGRAARTAATAANCPSIMASRMSAGAQTSMPAIAGAWAFGIHCRESDLDIEETLSGHFRVLPR